MNLNRIFALGALLLAVGAGPARAADEVPARPKPFTFVTDQANVLQPADEKRLENGLRRYADNTGTQVVVLTVPSLGGQDVNAYARQVGSSWGVGEKGKNNGVVVLVASQDHKLSIEPGSGLRGTLTPTVIRQVIGEMTPDFKQNNYAGGLRQGLNTLMAKANPGSAPKATPTTEPASGAAMSSTDQGSAATVPAASQAMSSQADPSATEAPPSSGGIGFLPILIGIAVIGGGIWLVSKLFRRSSNNSNNGSGNSPSFYPNQPNQSSQPNFYPNQGAGGNYGGGYGGPAQSSGSGIGGMLATGAAAAAGAYLGNRMAEGHTSDSSAHNFSSDNLGNAGTGAGVAGGTAAAGDYFSSRNGGESSNDASPDYFADNSSSDSNDYFSGNDNSYDDSSGGGGFDDSSSDNSGSW